MTRCSMTVAALVALLPLLAGCAAAGGAAANAGIGDLPFLGTGAPRHREPSDERPKWLGPPPVATEHIPVPDDGFADALG